MKKTNILEKILGFSFGVIFVSVLLVLNVLIPDPNQTQYETFKIILALAAAGIGGILTGFIQIKGVFGKLALRAGGALALFLVIYFFSPAMPKPDNSIKQTINGDNGAQINVNNGVITINRSDSSKGKSTK